MGIEWPVAPLADLATIHDSLRKPVTKSNRQPGPYPYYGASGVTDYVEGYLFDGTYLLVAEDGDNLRSRNTPIAFVAEGKFWVNNHAHILKGVDDLDTKYLCYAMQYAEIDSYISGSTRPKITQADLKKIPVSAPPKEIRHKIATYIGVLDDKIELNRQINATLESMAQALFKSWFVDFDPVIDNALAAGNPIPEPLQARADKRAALLAAASAADTFSASATDNAHPTQTAPHTEPGTTAPATPLQPLPADLRALFPGSFVFNEEMGWVPEGWEVTTFGNVSACFDSKRIPLSKRQREEKKPGEIPYYGATSVMDHINEWIFDDVYLLIGEDGSVIKEDGAPFTQYIWGRAWVNNHAHVLQGKEDVSTEHLMLFMQHQNMSAYVTGAVQLKINQKNMNSIPFVKASSELNKYFSSCIAPYYTKYRSCREQVETLSELRDSLLPKLLSGQIQISSVQNLAAGGLCNP